jgi:sec-independent protein translocase protein TatA
VLGNLNGWHLLILVVIILLLFGASRLPGLAKSVGQSMKIFKSEVKEIRESSETDGEPNSSAVPTSPARATSTE